MSPLVELTAVGGLLKATDSDRYQPFARGDRISVSDEDAAMLIGNGQAELVDDTTAPDAEEEAPQPGAIPVSDADIDLEEGGTPVTELRKFASDRRINLHGATRRPEIVTAIQQAMDEEGGG